MKNFFLRSKNFNKYFLHLATFLYQGFQHLEAPYYVFKSQNKETIYFADLSSFYITKRLIVKNLKMFKII